jgi:hypothetical protein
MAMNKLFLISAAIALTSLCSCQKQQTDVERNAEVERRVQERLAAERQEQQQQLDQRQADVDAGEKTLTDKESSAAATPAQSEQAESESTEPDVPAPRRGGAITTGYTTFYNKLEPYGDWIETSDYGFVFHPREAASSLRWRPYTDGRWVYTDAGWTWISEEPFGWATYHYGRWTRLRGIGWVWVPGNQWAPAWVSWRKSNDYVGWAPLPPEARFDQRTGIRNWSDSYYDVGPDQYCFVASREFGASRVEPTLLPPERNVAIISQTTNVTNITYNSTTIVNEGPSYDELRAISREPVQRFRLERNVNVDVSAQPPRSEVRGETVVVAAPVIAAPVATERPTTVKQTVGAAAVDLGWAAIANQDEAKKMRQKMKSEATPPSNAPPKNFVRGAVLEKATPPLTGGGTTSSPSAPTPAMPPRDVTASSPASSDSPTASQRRGRLLLPPGTPTPSVSVAATPIPTPVKRPTAIEEPTLIPAPSAPPHSGSQRPPAPGQFKSQAQKFNPRKVEPMPSASPSTSATASASPKGWTGKGFRIPNESQSVPPNSTSSPAAASTPTSPSEKLTKQEKKEQEHEARKELKRERREGSENASPSATP